MTGQDLSGNSASGSAPQRSATGCGLAALVVWSSSVAVIRGMSESVGTLTGAAVSATLGGMLSMAYVWARGQSPMKMLRLPRLYLVVCGPLFVCCSTSIYLAVGWASSRSATLAVGLVNYLWPALTVALSVPILRRRARWYLPIGCVIAVAGTAVAVFSHPEFRWSEFRQGGPAVLGPILLAATSGVTWALYSNLVKRWGSTEGGAVPLFVLATAAGLWLLRLTRPEITRWSTRGLLETCFMGLASLAAAYALWDYGLRRGNHLLLSLASYFVPIASMALAAAYLGVVPPPGLWIGCALVVAGALVCKWSLRENSS